jgi:hypothetical protein
MTKSELDLPFRDGKKIEMGGCSIHEKQTFVQKVTNRGTT